MIKNDYYHLLLKGPSTQQCKPNWWTVAQTNNFLRFSLPENSVYDVDTQLCIKKSDL